LQPCSEILQRRSLNELLSGTYTFSQFILSSVRFIIIRMQHDVQLSLLHVGTEMIGKD